MIFSERAGFNLISPFYDVAKRLIFQNQIDQTQLHFLNKYPPKGNQLIIGGGTGLYLSKILAYEEVRNVVYLDLSDRMISKTKKRIATDQPNKFHQVQFVCQSALTYNTPIHTSFDCIHTPFFLDCLNDKDLKIMIKLLRSWLMKDGLVYFSDFHDNSKWFHKVTLKLLYYAFNIFMNSKRNSLPDFSAKFTNERFKTLDEILLFKKKTIATVYKS